MELNTIMQVLGNPNFSFKEFTGGQKPDEDLSFEEREKKEEEKKIYDEKLQKSEETISEVLKKFEGLNKYTLKMLQHTPSKIISEMAVRLFVGSRDIPKNTIKAMKFLEIALKKDPSSMAFREQKDVEFFQVMLTRMGDKDKDQASSFWEVNQTLKILAEEGHPNAMYVYGSELLLL